MNLREIMNDKVSKFLLELVTVPSGTTVSEAARIMGEKGVTELVVTKDGEPIGIITEKDLVYRVLAPGVLPSAPVDRVMSVPIQTIDENANVAEAVSKMIKLNIRRLVVTRNGKVVGIVTQKALLLAEGQKLGLPELFKPKEIACPYCGALMETADLLSRHIDDFHIGKGVLEGNVTKI